MDKECKCHQPNYNPVGRCLMCGGFQPAGIYPDTQLPAEVLEEIKEMAQLATDFLSNDETLSKDYLKGYKQGWKYGGKEYATKLHQADREIAQLKRWKMEAAELLTPIHAYVHKHIEANLGQCSVKLVLDRCKQFEALQAKFERCEGALKEAKETINWMWQHMKEPDGQTLLRVDEFNRPANALHIIDEALSGEGEKEVQNG